MKNDFSSNRILPEGCGIIYKTYTSESVFMKFLNLL